MRTNSVSVNFYPMTISCRCLGIDFQFIIESSAKLLNEKLPSVTFIS